MVTHPEGDFYKMRHLTGGGGRRVVVLDRGTWNFRACNEITVPTAGDLGFFDRYPHKCAVRAPQESLESAEVRC